MPHQSMQMSAGELIDRWLYSAEFVMRAHYKAAQIFNRKHYLIGVPALVVSTAVGTTVFATLQQDVDVSIQIATGGAALLAAMLTALQTFLSYSQRAARHKAAGADYAALIREIHQQLAFPSSVSDELREFVDNIRKRFDTLSKESPSLPSRFWDKLLQEEVE